MGKTRGKKEQEDKIEKTLRRFFKQFSPYVVSRKVKIIEDTP